MAWTNPRTWAVGELVTAALLNTHLRDNLNSVVPIGTLIYRVAAYSAAETAVEGRWLMANGVAVSRTTYVDLFNYLNGMTPALPFGTGDGSLTFNLPDLRGRAPWGIGTHSTVDALGDSDGAALANRSSSHHHIENVRTGAIGTGPFSQGNDTLGTGEKTSGNASLQDTPAFLVAGAYFIKYVT